MDLIATYYLFIITTSFLGLITAVWVGFRCKMAFFMTITTPVMAIKIDVNHSNYGERLTLPIVFARTKQGLDYN